MTNAGTLMLPAANTNTGNIVINGGIVSDMNVQNANYPAVGGLGNPMIAGRTVTINNGGILSLDASGGNEFGGGGVTNLLGYVINPGGVMRITSGNATIGPVTLNGGTMDVLAGASSTNIWGAFEFTGDITVGGTTPSTIQSEVTAFYCLTAASLVPYRTFNVTNGSVLNVTATLGESGSTLRPAGLIKTGAGTMTLSVSNAYTAAPSSATACCWSTAASTTAPMVAPSLSAAARWAVTGPSAARSPFSLAARWRRARAPTWRERC